MPKILLVLLCVGVALAGCAPYTPPPDTTARASTSVLFDSALISRIAFFVEDSTGRHRQEGVIRRIEDEFMAAALDKGYVVVPRSDIQQVMNERSYQTSHRGAPVARSFLVDIGKSMKADAIVVVTINNSSVKRVEVPGITFNNKAITYFNAHADLGARMFDANNGELLWQSSHAGKLRVSGDRLEQEAEAIPPIARVVARALPRKRQF